MTLAIENKTVLVTGGNSGIGYETARALAKAGAKVILTSRNIERAEAVAKGITAESGHETIGLRLDLTVKTGIHAFADEFLKRFDRLDVLVNNAGALFHRRRENADGFEMTWAVNHLGPFLLTARLLPLLRKPGEARIVVTASDAHLGGAIDFADLGIGRGYNAFGAYQRSKLGNVLFTLGLARRLDGTEITANCLHPGVVATGFFRFVPIFGPVVPILMRPFYRSPEKGAETAIFLAGDESMAGRSGGYYFDKAPAKMSALAGDTALQDRVWDLSVEQTGAVWGFDKS